MRAIPAEQRFWAKVDRASSGCWNWTDKLDREGYGRLRDGGTIKAAHRFAYELLVGEIATGLVIDHLCRNRACVNPEHLEPVTDQVNILRGVSLSARRAAQTHCKRGHEFTTENTYLWTDRRGRTGRICRTCRREYVRKTDRAA